MVIHASCRHVNLAPTRPKRADLLGTDDPKRGNLRQRESPEFSTKIRTAKANEHRKTQFARSTWRFGSQTLFIRHLCEPNSWNSANLKFREFPTIGGIPPPSFLTGISTSRACWAKNGRILPIFTNPSPNAQQKARKCSTRETDFHR
jgi:hypothetical protein